MTPGWHGKWNISWTGDFSQSNQQSHPVQCVGSDLCLQVWGDCFHLLSSSFWICILARSTLSTSISDFKMPASSLGWRFLQGLHHAAVNSTTTGLSFIITFLLNSLLVPTRCTWYVAIMCELVDTCLTFPVTCLVKEDIRYFADIILYVSIC